MLLLLGCYWIDAESHQARLDQAGGDACTPVAWYADADGDGVGAGDATTACEAPAAGMATEGEDCDDADATRFPGAPELCDGARQDCADEAWVDDAGTFTWTPAASAVAEDWGARAAAGHDAAPASLTLDESGTLAVCAGTWYASIDVAAPSGSTVRLHDPTDSGAAVLDGGSAERVLAVPGSEDGRTFVEVEGLTLQRGYTPLGGGNVWASVAVSLTMTDVEVLDGYAEEGGGGLFLETYGGELTMTDVLVMGNETPTHGGGLRLGDGDWADASASLVRVEFVGNRAGEHGAGFRVGSAAAADLDGCHFEDNEAELDGGGLSAFAGPVTLTSCTFDGNVAGRDGGALEASQYAILDVSGGMITGNVAGGGGGGVQAYGAAVTLDGVLVADNEAAAGGGAHVELGEYPEASLSCVGSGGGGGVRGNTADGAGDQAWVGAGATLSSDGCDWADPITSDEGEIWSEASGASETFGDDATFECGVEGWP